MHRLPSRDRSIGGSRQADVIDVQVSRNAALDAGYHEVDAHDRSHLVAVGSILQKRYRDPGIPRRRRHDVAVVAGTDIVGEYQPYRSAEPVSRSVQSSYNPAMASGDSPSRYM